MVKSRGRVHHHPRLSIQAFTPNSSQPALIRNRRIFRTGRRIHSGRDHDCGGKGWSSFSRGPAPALNSRNRAGANPKVGETEGLAKEWATFHAEAGISATTLRPPTSRTIICGTATPSSRDMSSSLFSTSMTVTGLGAILTNATSIRINMSPGGQLTCAKAP